MTTPASEIARILAEEDDFVVASHVNPDGDAVGATAAMGYILAALNKHFCLIIESGVPRHLEWVQTPRPMLAEMPRWKPGRFIVLDCGARDRVGPHLSRRLEPEATINIDHHLGNPLFGAVNWVDASYASTGEMVAELADALDIPLSGPLGEAVYLAIATDTGNFSYDNTTPRTHELAARIIGLGLHPGSFNARIQNQWTPEKLKLLSQALAEVRFFAGGKVGVAALPQEIFTRTGASRAEAEGIINFIRQVRGVAIALTLREEPTGQIKFSLRSSGETNVQAIAAKFGGGGHKNASGGTLNLPLAEAERVLLAEAEAVAAGSLQA